MKCPSGTQFTRFISTKVPMLTQKDLQARTPRDQQPHRKGPLCERPVPPRGRYYKAPPPRGRYYKARTPRGRYYKAPYTEGDDDMSAMATLFVVQALLVQVIQVMQAPKSAFFFFRDRGRRDERDGEAGGGGACTR